MLARIKVSDLLGLRLSEGLHMLVDAKDDRWAAHAPQSSRVAMFEPANNEMTLQYSEQLGLWVAPQLDTNTAQLVLWTAKDVQGPWESAVVHSIAAPYDDLNLFRCYAGKGHPELARAAGEDGKVELVFSYVCNAASDSRLLFEEEHLMGLYSPKFLRVSVAAAENVATDKKQ